MGHAAAAAEKLKLAERCQSAGGSFLEWVPQGDLHLLGFILHDWNDDTAVCILNNCRRAMRPNGRIVIVEGFLGEPGKLPPSSMVDTQTALIAVGRPETGSNRRRRPFQCPLQILSILKAEELERSGGHT